MDVDGSWQEPPIGEVMRSLYSDSTAVGIFTACQKSSKVLLPASWSRDVNKPYKTQAENYAPATKSSRCFI